MRALFAVVFVLLTAVMATAVSPRAMALGIAAARSCDLLRPVPEVPGQPARDRPPGHDPRATRPLPRDGRRLDRVGDRSVLPRQVPRRAVGRLERTIATAIVFIAWIAISRRSPRCSGSCTAKSSVYGKQITERRCRSKAPTGSSSIRASRPTSCSSSARTRCSIRSCSGGLSDSASDSLPSAHSPGRSRRHRLVGDPQAAEPAV